MFQKRSASRMLALHGLSQCTRLHFARQEAAPHPPQATVQAAPSALKPSERSRSGCAPSRTGSPHPTQTADLGAQMKTFPLRSHRGLSWAHNPDPDGELIHLLIPK